MTDRCIYGRMPLKDGDPEWRPSEEHIVHATMGGSRLFATQDVSSKYNSDYGSRIDAPFVELLPYAIKRQMLRIKNYKGDLKSIQFQVTPTDSDRTATVTIDPDLNVDVQFQPRGATTDRGTHTEYVFEGSSDDVERMFRGALSKATRKGETLYTPDGTVLKDILGGLKASQTTSHRSFSGQIVFSEEVWVRGICKMVLGLGHVILGPDWTFSPSADALRSVLEFPYERTSSWVKRNFARLPETVALTLGINDQVRNDNLHTLAVIPRSGSRGPIAIVSLFGGQAFNDIMVEVGPDAGILVTVNDTLDPRARIGVRINPVDRNVEWIDVAQWVKWSEPYLDPST